MIGTWRSSQDWKVPDIKSVTLDFWGAVENPSAVEFNLE